MVISLTAPLTRRTLVVANGGLVHGDALLFHCSVQRLNNRFIKEAVKLSD